MDIELARTFLEIIRSGSFVSAAERLHVTQTTITARVRNLEQQLNCQLFVRNRSGARLTADGERFSMYAVQLLQTWEKARLDLPLPQGRSRMLTLGGEIALWNPLLYKWLTLLQGALSDTVLRIEADMAPVLTERLSQGTLDVAVMHRVEYIPGLQIEQLFEEKLILVCAREQQEPYVYVDWGPDFRRQHDAVLPERARPLLAIDYAALALQYLLDRGGSGYFRTRVVSPYLANGQLQRVRNAPEFSYPVYLVHNKQNQNEGVLSALSVLHKIAEEELSWC